MTNNPLLDFSSLPRFDAIQPDHVAPAIAELLGRYQTLIDELTARPDTPTWDGFAAPITDMGEQLGRAWGIVGHLHSVNDVPAWRDAYNATLPDITRFYSTLGQNLALFAKYKALRDSTEYGRLSAARQRILDNEVRDFRLSGAELPEDRKPRFKEIQEELAALSTKFSENLLDATNAFAEYVTDASLLAGLPEDSIEAAREAAQRDDRDGWKFTLHMPSYLPVMQYADSRALRERMYRAYATRASEFGEPARDNSPLIDRILALRAEESRMLGFASFAELSMVPKMADSPDQVMDFLRDLARRARPHAQRDLDELRAFARNEFGLDDLQPWDMAWVSEKLRVQRYAFSEQEVKQYFPEHKVLEGLFRVVEGLYGVSIKPDSAPVWHPDVRFFRIERDGERGRELVGQFYLDLYARDTKRGGAWMDEAITRRSVAGGVQTPVAYLNCNFPSPVGGKPATFTHDDVITLFHETGHGLHHLLTRVDDLPVSGIHGVEWDAVELPSQFMENFCWEWDVLSGMTAHIDTGAALPRALYDKMIAARNFQSGMQTLRQIEFALFDLRLHHDFSPGQGKSMLQMLEEVRDEVAVVRPPAWNRFPHSFSHIFAGGYAAGYYSYKWAEVLSADAFEAFEEARGIAGTVLDTATGRRFWDEILAVGGSRPALESFKAFRGREPRPDALLRHSGMVETA
ncbi:M3 family metallopeptidase [Methyloversatilis thermotolerans]|uniref:M3 family metallopeptidase n=1 Tax=Methyloversatilis thermotolerans TaxID=1346290 RepID=UPI00038122BB|nr:M3 family metallopeptidase [Methyloversatilis thermotolerans]